MDSSSTLSTDITVHGAGSQLKMSESQTGAGNQEFWSLNVENFQNIENYPWDLLNNFCFHVYCQNSLFIGENDNAFFAASSAAAPAPLA